MVVLHADRGVSDYLTTDMLTDFSNNIDLRTDEETEYYALNDIRTTRLTIGRFPV
jgi:hypothetical protein